MNARRTTRGSLGPASVGASLVTKGDLHKLIDELPDTAIEGAGVQLRGIIKASIDPDQTWFWTPEWLTGEREADAELAKGWGVTYRSTDEFIAHLENPPPPESA